MGCGAAQFPREREAEPAIIVDAEDALDVLVQLYLRGQGGELEGLEHTQSSSRPSQCFFLMCSCIFHSPV